MDYKAQSSISIKRLRTNNGITLSFDNNGLPLMQSVDIDSPTLHVSPDWTVAANQPVRTPSVTNNRNLPVTLSTFVWKYNGTVINFTGAESSGWKASSDGKFMINTTTGAIKIVDNLASKTNYADDTLDFSCTATVAGVEYTVNGSLPIYIQKMGASSYFLSLLATTQQLTTDVTTTRVTAKLYMAGEEVTDFYLKWYKDNELWTGHNAKQETIGRSDVDGEQLFIAEAYKDSSFTTLLFRDAIRIVDNTDDLRVQAYINSSNKDIDTGSPVTVNGRIIKMSNGTDVTSQCTLTSWRMDVLRRDDWSIKKTASGTSETPTISVSTTETDDSDGTQHDVDVLCEISWNF